jgi:hypothetical protein
MASVELSPGIVIDPETGQVYVMEPEGGITAVDGASGAELWHSDAAERPLLLADDLLVGQAAPGAAAGLRLVMLRPADQGSVARESLVPLPAGVEPMIGRSADRSFDLAAEPLDGDAVLRWEFRERPLSGLPDDPFEVLPGEEGPDLLAPSPGAMALGAGVPVSTDTVVRGQIRLALADGAVVPMVEPSRSSEPMRLAQAVVPVVAPALEATGVPAAAGAAPAGGAEIQFLSRDGRHRLQSKRIADDAAWDKYLWHIYDVATGEKLGEIRNPVSYAPFVVLDGKIVHEAEPHARLIDGAVAESAFQVRAVDLTSGDVVWQHAVRDTRDMPPPPP